MRFVHWEKRFLFLYSNFCINSHSFWATFFSPPLAGDGLYIIGPNLQPPSRSQLQATIIRVNRATAAHGSSPKTLLWCCLATQKVLHSPARKPLRNACQLDLSACYTSVLSRVCTAHIKNLLLAKKNKVTPAFHIGRDYEPEISVFKCSTERVVKMQHIYNPPQKIRGQKENPRNKHARYTVEFPLTSAVIAPGLV
jgi:hypothetical protein